MIAPGDLYDVTGAASVQFAAGRGFRFRVIRVDPRTTYAGWAWLDGYVLGTDGQAVERRSIFVQVDGLIDVTPKPAQQPVRRPTNAGPTGIPQQRTRTRTTRRSIR